MRKLTNATVIGIILLLGSASAQESCPCVPVTYEWIALACDSWDCVASSVQGNPARSVVPMPSAGTDHPWIVLRRIASGSGTVSPDAPFKVDSFDSIPVASAQYFITSQDLQPVLLTAPDGKVLLVTRNASEVARRRRAAR